MEAFIVWESMGLMLLFYGIYTRQAKKPMPFWNIRQQIEVSDVKKYNHALAKLWMAGAVLFMGLGIPLLTGQDSAFTVITILGSMWWSIGLMVVYTRIEKKYRR